jgi:hypothetical protein
MLFYAESSFTLDEQLAILGAAEDWRTWTKGRVQILVMWNSEGSPRIGKKSATDPETLRIQETRAKELGRPTLQVFGWAPGQDIYLVTDHIPEGQLRGVAAHEMGHALGLRRPNCHAPDDCYHLTVQGSVMSPWYAETNAWSAEDLAMCRASCLCD